MAFGVPQGQGTLHLSDPQSHEEEQVHLQALGMWGLYHEEHGQGRTSGATGDGIICSLAYGVPDVNQSRFPEGTC